MCLFILSSVYICNAITIILTTFEIIIILLSVMKSNIMKILIYMRAPNPVYGGIPPKFCPYSAVPPRERETPNYSKTTW